MADPLANTPELIARIYAYVAYRIGQGADAEDITSEVFERAVRYRSSYKRREGEPVQWLIGIARRCIADHATRPTPGPLPTVEEAWLDDDAGRAGDRIDLARALHVLDEREQELVALRFGADLSARQIGDLLYLRANTVDVAIHRALAKLRAELER